MEIFVSSELRNVAGHFKAAIWRKYPVCRSYPSCKEAARHHNLKNCNYAIKDKFGHIIRIVENGKLDGYGRRYN